MRQSSGRDRLSGIRANSDRNYSSFYTACERVLESERRLPDFNSKVEMLQEEFLKGEGIMANRLKIPVEFIELRLLDKLMFHEGALLERTGKEKRADRAKLRSGTTRRLRAAQTCQIRPAGSIPSNACAPIDLRPPDSSVAGHESIGTIHQDRIDKTTFLDAGSDLFDLPGGVRAGIFNARFELPRVLFDCQRPHSAP